MLKHPGQGWILSIFSLRPTRRALALGSEVSGGPGQHPGNQVPCKKHSISIPWCQPHPSKALALQEESETAPVLTESQREKERDQCDRRPCLWVYYCLLTYFSSLSRSLKILFCAFC